MALTKIADGGMPSGSIIQVVQSSIKTRLALATSGNYTKITGLEAAITPLATSSKILVTANLNICGHGSYYVCAGRLYVNDAHISDASADDATYGSNDIGSWFAVGAQQWSNFTRYQISPQYLHSPSSTSQQTYSVYVADNRDNSTIYLNRQHYETNADYMNTSKSYLTAMEIAG
jgi:hypothetical protein|tara:strand:+ start:33 stop:557 length:525 start_codon:yes stop_codon:yes gene_type:complete